MCSTDNVVSRGLLGLVALAALGIAAPAHAQVIFSNFGPGDTFLDGGFSIRGASAPGAIPGRVDFASSFTTDANGYVNIVFEGAMSNPVAAGTPGVTMRLMGDAGGVPDEGVVLATSPSLNPVTAPAMAILTWNLGPTVTLTANTKYWFAASATDPSGFNTWQFNSTDHRGFASWAAGTWTSNSKLSPAFRVSGSVLSGGNTTGGGNGGVVPEPSEWAAMGVLSLGLTGLVVRKRRTR